MRLPRFTLTFLMLLAACAPTPRPQAAAAVIGTDTPMPAEATSEQLAPTVALSATVPPASPSESSGSATAAPPTVSPTPGPTPTLHPELPAACAAAPPASATLQDLGYVHSICRSPVVSPDERWLAFAQLTEALNSDELWIMNRVTGNQTLVNDPLWAGEAFRALDTYEWSSTNELLIIHRLASGAAPASAYDPETGDLVNLGNISTLSWNQARTAAVGWEFRSGCLFTRVVGYDFAGDRVLQSAAPEEEIVGQVYWLPDDSGFVYSRREIVGDCPGCYYRAAELVLADAAERIYTTLVSDPGFDYVLLGFQDDRIVIGERPYTYHTCEAPQIPPAEMKYYLLDPTTRELTAFGEP